MINSILMPEEYDFGLRNALWYLFAGTRGGMTRIQIVKLLQKRPYNTNQLHDILKLDYKTIQHHIKVLTENRIITCSDEKKYGSMYFLSPFLEKNSHIIDEIVGRIGENDKKGRRKRFK